jgi:hypothetical protein
MPWYAGVPRSEIDWGPTIDTKKCVPSKELRRFYKEQHMWKLVKEAMIAEGKIPAANKGSKEVAG